MNNIEKKLIKSGKFEDVIEIEGHYFLINKKDKICVLPYTISTTGLLDKLGIIEDFNYVKEEKVLTLINDYISTDDKTDLIAANRILFNIIGINISNADLWMYLGSLYNNMTNDSPIKIYCVDITNIEIKSDEEVNEEEQRKNFKMLDSSKVIQSDDILFLGAFQRLLNFFYINSLVNSKNK
jgi:hypothetical protein